MDSCQNQNLKFDIDVSKQDTWKKKLDLPNDFDKVKIQQSIVEIDEELEQLQQSPAISYPGDRTPLDVDGRCC